MKPNDHVKLTPLGAGNEVGRSCFILSYQRSGCSGSIMLDCGLHPALSETRDYVAIQALPFFDLEDYVSTLSLILITHFHNDHIAALPYLLRCLRDRAVKEGKPELHYIPPVYMTAPTLKIFKESVTDVISQTKLYTHEDVEFMAKNTKLLTSFYQTERVNGISFTAMPAGHVIGAAMFHISIDNFHALYTGDFSCEPEDRHLQPATFPQVKLDLLIIESTYGTIRQKERMTRERDFIDLIVSTVKKDGCVLLPVFSIGRVQELLCILQEYWREHEQEMARVTIYYVSAIADNARQLYSKDKGFLRHGDTGLSDIQTGKRKDKIIYTKTRPKNPKKPYVMFCTPGMLQSGVSKEMYNELCGSPDNLLLVTGYATQDTLLYKLLEGKPPGGYADAKMRIEELSFSAHSDYNQTLDVLRKTRPRNVAFIHGSEKSISSLKRTIANETRVNFSEGGKEADKEEISFHYPRNGETVTFAFTNPVQLSIKVDTGAEDTAQTGVEDSRSIAAIAKALDKKKMYIVQDGFAFSLYNASSVKKKMQRSCGGITLNMSLTIVGDSPLTEIFESHGFRVTDLGTTILLVPGLEEMHDTVQGAGTEPKDGSNAISLAVTTSSRDVKRVTLSFDLFSSVSALCIRILYIIHSASKLQKETSHTCLDLPSVCQRIGASLLENFNVQLHESLTQELTASSPPYIVIGDVRCFLNFRGWNFDPVFPLEKKDFTLLSDISDHTNCLVRTLLP